MAATTAVLALAGTASSGSAAGRHETPAVAANATAATATGRRRPARPSVSAVTRTQPSVAPARATTKESTGGPPIAAQPCVGSPAWLIASRPHGKPPHGQRSRNASAATHQPATASGHQRRLSSSRWAMANTAKMSAEAMASATQANQARLTTQASSGKKNARPKASPTANAPRSERPYSVTTSSAGLTTASGQTPAGANAAASSRPPASPAGSASRSRSSGRGVRRAAVSGPSAAATLVPVPPGSASACSVITLRRVVGVRPRREAGNFAIYR